MAIRTAVNRALTAITALPTAAALVDGNLTLLTTATASSSATLDFTSSIDSTYDSYVFKFINIHPSAASGEFQVNFRDGSTAYDATKTTTFFLAYADEADTEGDVTVSYANAAKDIAQGTGFQIIADDMANLNDGSGSGTLHLYAPSNTTFVKHFTSRITHMHQQPAAFSSFVAGYCNVTAAIDGVQFKFSSGNIDSGVIKMYGVGDKQS
jgi:hypothetical protein